MPPAYLLINIDSLITLPPVYSQCRTQVSGSWAPSGEQWQCSTPGQKPPASRSSSPQSAGSEGPFNSGGSELSPNTISIGGTSPFAGSGGSATSNGNIGQSRVTATANTAFGTPTGNSQSGSAGQQISTSRSGSPSATSASPSQSSGINDNKYTNRTAQKGNCSSTPSTDGWHGVGSTSVSNVEAR